MAEPAYTRLPVDERRRRLLDAGTALFAEHAFEEISMRQVAEAAGVSKALLYHYFPSKAELFNAAIEERTLELERVLERRPDGPPLEALAASVESYLRWIEANSRWWSKLIQSAATLPQARDAIERSRARTLERILDEVTSASSPPPVLRSALRGWLGYVDAAILDWIDHGDLTIAQLRDLITAAFVASLLAAHQTDPTVELRLQ